MNSIESAQQYMSVAELGDLQAQFALAVMYTNGHGGLEKDYILAYKWATMAAMNGNVESAMLVELLIPQMTRQALETSRKMIKNCKSNKL